MAEILKMGRKKKEWDQDQFEKLCVFQCLEEEIASWFDISVDTLNARCKETYGETFAETNKRLRDGGKIGLRRSQMHLALKGNCSMLIWLGKQFLDQVDSREVIIPDADQYFKTIADAIARSDTNSDSVLPGHAPIRY